MGMYKCAIESIMLSVLCTYIQVHHANEMEAIFCQRDRIIIACQSGILHITYSNWGRTNPNVCKPSLETQKTFWNRTCTSVLLPSSYIASLKNQTVDLDPSTFSEVCNTTYQYADVHWKCLPNDTSAEVSCRIRYASMMCTDAVIVVKKAHLVHGCQNGMSPNGTKIFKPNYGPLNDTHTCSDMTAHLQQECFNNTFCIYEFTDVVDSCIASKSFGAGIDFECVKDTQLMSLSDGLETYTINDANMFIIVGTGGYPHIFKTGLSTTLSISFLPSVDVHVAVIDSHLPDGFCIWADTNTLHVDNNTDKCLTDRNIEEFDFKISNTVSLNIETGPKSITYGNMRGTLFNISFTDIAFETNKNWTTTPMAKKQVSVPIIGSVTGVVGFIIIILIISICLRVRRRNDQCEGNQDSDLEISKGTRESHIYAEPEHLNIVSAFNNDKDEEEVNYAMPNKQPDETLIVENEVYETNGNLAVNTSTNQDRDQDASVIVENDLYQRAMNSVTTNKSYEKKGNDGNHDALFSANTGQYSETNIAKREQYEAVIRNEMYIASDKSQDTEISVVINYTKA